MFQGRLSVRRAIGGPIRMYEATEAAAREGTFSYLMLMALISINLGLINLLPIPMLDGGHLAFIAYEAMARLSRDHAASRDRVRWSDSCC